MIINEAGLTRAIKQIYKTLGYTVFVHEGEIVLLSKYWYLECNKSIFPRKALAAIVEQAGFIPDEDEAYEVKKDMDPQQVFFDTVMDERRKWTSAQHTEEAVMTHVTFRGLRMFQALGDLERNRLFGAGEVQLEILEWPVVRDTKAIVSDTYKIGYYGDEEKVILAACNRDTFLKEEKDRQIWECLETLDLRPPEKHP